MSEENHPANQCNKSSHSRSKVDSSPDEQKPLSVRICPNCGKYNPKSSWSCKECGVTLSLDTLKQVSPSSTIHQQPAIEQKSSVISRQTSNTQRRSNEVMVKCPTCNGHGTVFLEYKSDFATDDVFQDERWLPCADCDGSGKLPKRVILNRQYNERLVQFLSADRYIEFFIELLWGKSDYKLSDEALSNKNEQIGWKLWLKWVVSTTIGFVIAGGLAVGGGAADALKWGPARLAIAGAVFGLLVGIAQWLVIRRLFDHSKSWVIASVLGSAAGFALFDIVIFSTLPSIDSPTNEFSARLVMILFVLGAAIGSVVGLAQWFVLRNRVKSAGWWVIALAISGLVAISAPFILVAFIIVSANSGSIVAFLLGLTIILILLTAPGSISGVALVLLFRQPVQSETA